ncbi:MAG: GntR family transcriptional regulator [bacterium]
MPRAQSLEAPPVGEPGEAAFASTIAATLLAEIVGGVHGPGARLPAERQLVARFATSRVTLRAALARLAARGVIAVHRGSGAVVRPWREWSLAVLPAFLHHGAANPVFPRHAEVLGDVLALRRAVTADALERAATRLVPGDLAAARRAVDQAWRERHDAARFAQADFAMARAILEAAGLVADVWLVNDLTAIYVEAVRPLGADLPVRPDYVSVHLALCDALERGDAAAARRIVAEHFGAQDRALLARLGIGTSPPAPRRARTRRPPARRVPARRRST